MGKGTFSMEDAGFVVGINVKLTKRDKNTGRVLETRQGHNTCLKMQLMGIVKWMNGEFNESAPYLLGEDWIPRYLGIGTNIATYQNPDGVSTEVNINDTRLLSEISPRIKLPERNKIVNRSTQRYVQLVISSYLPSEYYNDEIIAEAGLFSRETGNNCLFRIVFDGINKTEDSVIEVDWTISVISVESTNEPYEEIDKSDLRLSMEQLLDLYGQKVPQLKESTEHIKSPAIPQLQSQKTTQTAVDEATQLLSTDYSTLKDVVIESGGIDTSDADATNNDLVENKTAYAKNVKLRGTLKQIQANGFTINTFHSIETLNGDIYVKTLNSDDKVLRQGSFVCIEQGNLANGIHLTADKIKDGETILGITGNYKGDGIDTSQGTALSTDIADGKIVFVKGEKIVGNLPVSEANQYYQNWSTTTYQQLPGTGDISVQSTVSRDSLLRSNTIVVQTIHPADLAELIGLTPNKIKDGETILGITGTYKGN